MTTSFDFFNYLNNELYCEDVKVKDIVEKAGSPVYIYSKNSILEHFIEIRNAFEDVSPLICFSVKANSNLSVIKVLADAGSGFDVVSGGELFRVLELGVSPDKIVFAGVGKTSEEIKYALEMIEKGDVVLDGTLEARGEMEQRHLDELRFEAVTKMVNVTAVAKTTTIVTEKGSSYAAMLNRKEGSWLYHPVVEINSEQHKAEMFFVKLHEKSRHVFRTEVFKEQASEIGNIAAELKENARELTFPGYPYGLILVDKLARVSEQETGYLKAKMFAAAGNKWSDLRKDLAALDAHEILDNM